VAKRGPADRARVPRPKHGHGGKSHSVLSGSREKHEASTKNSHRGEDLLGPRTDMRRAETGAADQPKQILLARL
jgi:hypothetical protein